MFDVLVKGGPILWLILLLFVPIIAITIERLWFFKKIHGDEDKLFARVRAAIEKRHYDEALAICDTVEAPLAALVRTGLEYRDRPQEVQTRMIEETAAREVPRLERAIGWVSTIAQISPLLGLLGTVSGIINAFGILGKFGNVTDPSVLAKGISEALLTTAAGIVVAVPAMVIYYFLAVRANREIQRLESRTGELSTLFTGKGVS
ncbi:MAG: MotA/TolQ/ExbB proton channel family protein [Spirochaetales bacterium]|nr:MotA/TolQ/ExbB proton channel family protein [Spirochaetales bacterium]